MKIDAANRTPLLVALVLSTVVIQLLVAIVLKQLALGHSTGATPWLLAGLLVAVGLNGLRFLIWGFTHKHYPLSHSYPLTSLFFPCVLGLSLWYGDTVSPSQVAAVALIMAGVALMNWSSPHGEA